MKELIVRIIEDSNLIFETYTFQNFETNFAYFEKQDDFFIFIFSPYSALKEKLSIKQDKDIEYALNSYIVDYKSEFLQEYKERSLDYNLSLILVLEEDVEISKLDFIEENPFNSKKYILHYNKADLEILKEKISQNKIDPSNIIHTLNILATENSSFLKDTAKSCSWYDFLLKLFIKIPFLNFEGQNDNRVKELQNLGEVILSKLDDKQNLILDRILTDSENNLNVENLITEIAKIINEDE